MTTPGTVHPAVGINKTDLANQYTGMASGGDGSAPYQKVEQAMARKAIVDAKRIGISYFRVAISGFAPNTYNTPGDLDLWRSNPAAYWALIDQMMNDLNASGIKVIASFWSVVGQFPAMANDSMLQLMTNPNSPSYTLLQSYVSDFVNRYKNNPALLMYELTNELNLQTDMDIVGECQNNPPAWDTQRTTCQPLSDFTTAQMIAYTTRLASYIKSMDPNHPITSGYGLPRTNAQHLRAKPDWLGGDGTADTQAQFQQNLTDITQGMDVVSIHFYDDSSGDNDRFGVTGQMNAGLLSLIKQTTDGMGKTLFVGEIGDQNPYVYNVAAGSENPGAMFLQNLLAEIQSLGIPYSAPWLWEFYQFDLINNYTPTSAYNLEPGFTDLHDAMIMQASQRMGNPVASPPAVDTTPPIVVLTWPVEGTAMGPSQVLHAVASDDSGSVSKVEFWVDGGLVATVTQPPYLYTLDATQLVNTQHSLMAKAYDAAGNSASYTTAVSGGLLSTALSVNPNTLSFSAVAGAANPAAQTTVLTNSGTGASNWSVTSDSPWLSVSPVNGSLSAGGSQSLAVNVTAGSLAAGAYTGVLTFVDQTNQPQTLTVQLTVLAPLSINKFGASPLSITPGQVVTLTWDVSNADSVTIEPDIGDVDLSGTASDIPSTTTLYTLTAYAAGQEPDFAVVKVTMKPAPPTINKTSVLAVTVGDPATAVTLQGQNFTPSTAIAVNGKAQVSAFVSPTQMTVTLPTSLLESPEPLQVTVMDSSAPVVESSAPVIQVVPVPQTPQLENVPSTLSPDGTLQVVDQGFSTTYNWALVPPSGGAVPRLETAGFSASALGSGAYTLPTHNAVLPLAPLDLSPGPYQFLITATNLAGRTSAPAQVTITILAPSAGGVRVYPNPWKVTTALAPQVTFDRLTGHTTLKIFTLSGHSVRVWSTDSASTTWDLKNGDGQEAASGLYFYSLTNDQNQHTRGKLVLIR